jgi:hypothetical protein
MNPLFCAAAILSLLLIPQSLRAAGADPLTGARISLRGLQGAMAAPPLPSLEMEARGGAALQAAIIFADIDDNLPVSNDPIPMDLHTSGSFYGGGLGVGVNSRQESNVNFFGWGMYNFMKGKLSVDTGGAAVTDFNDMSSTGIGFVAGISKRIAASGSSPLALGLFAGPALLHFTSEAYVGGPSTTGTAYTASPWSYGGVAGAQLGIQISSLYLNPYGLYYKDFTNGCKSFVGPGGGDPNAPLVCSEGVNYLKMKMSFAAYGINVGFLNFFLNVYSTVKNDSSLGGINLRNFAFTYVSKF